MVFGSSEICSATLPVDSDGDGVRDVMDNCVAVPNLDQRDVDLHGYGSIYNPDFNKEGFVNAADLGYMKTHFFSGDPLADLDGNGFVHASDLTILNALFLGRPGPSQIVP